MTEAKNIKESDLNLKKLDITLQKIDKTLSALHNGISEIQKATEFVDRVSLSLGEISVALVRFDGQMSNLSNTTVVASKELQGFTDIILGLKGALDELNPNLGEASSQLRGFGEECSNSATSNSFGEGLKQQTSSLNEWAASVTEKTNGIKSLMETVNESFTFGENISKVGSSVIKKVGDIGDSFKQLKAGLKEGVLSKLKIPSFGNTAAEIKSLGQSFMSGPVKSAVEGVKKYTSSLKDMFTTSKNGSSLFEKLGGWFSKINMASRLSALGLGVKTLAISGLAWVSGTALPFLGGLVTQTWAWTAALLANPVTLIVVGILALIAAVVVCWNTFAEFRAAILTAWEVVSGFGSAIWDFLVAPFKVASEIIGGLMNGISIWLSGGSFMDGIKAVGDGIKRGLDEGAKSLISASDKAKDATSGIGGKYEANLKSEQAKDKAKDQTSKDGKVKIEPQVTPTIPAFSAVQQQVVPRENAAMQMTFAPNITISSELTEKSKSDLMEILQKNASHLANIINEQNRKEGRLNYGVS